MGNYFSSPVAPVKKRKRTESGSNEHDFDAALQRTSSSQIDTLTEETSSRLGEVLSQMNEPEGAMRSRLGSMESSHHLNIRNTDIDSLMYNRSRINRANSTRSSNQPTYQTKLIRNSQMESLSLKSNRSNCSNSSGPYETDSVDIKLNTPAHKKMKSTADYIYTHFFLNGEQSDLTIEALGKEWKLHKIYLCQSPYFETMFKCGSKWKESNQSKIQIAIPDANINEKSLFITFGSFYREDIEIVPAEVMNVLACASLLSLEGLISKCAEIMIDNINYKSVVGYHEASVAYGVKAVTDSTLKWLCTNIMSSSEFFLTDLKLSLFEAILSMNELLIIQVETDLYTLCKKWLYFQLNKPTTACLPNKLDKDWQKTCNDFFKNFLTNTDSIGSNGSSSDDSSAIVLEDIDDSGTEETSLVLDVGCTSFSSNSPMAISSIAPSTKNTTTKCLLERPAFQKYVNIFKKIRLQHILTDQASLHVLYNDRIIPNQWIEPHYYRNWLHTIYIDQEHLSHEFEITRPEFDTQCARFGRALAEDTPATWRWVGFNYGIDLLISHTTRNLTLKRNVNQMQSPYKGLLSQKSTIRIFYVMKVVKLDAFGNEMWSKETELTCLDLNRNDEKFVVAIDGAVEYPVLLNFRVIMHPYYENNLANNLFS